MAGRRRVVSVETAQAAREANARRRLNNPLIWPLC